MKKQDKAKRKRKRSAVKDLSAKKAAAVKGGLSLAAPIIDQKLAPVDYKYSPQFTLKY